MANPFEVHERPDDPAPAALAAAVDCARKLGLTVAEPRVLSDGFWLMVHLAPSPVVARVSTFTGRMRDPAASLGRELAVTGWLADRGVPVVAPTRAVPAGPHDHHGHSIGLWDHVESVSGADAPSMPDCLAMLPELHRVLDDYPDQLPPFGPLNDDLAYCLGRLDRAADLLTDDQVAAITAADARLRSFRLDPPGPLSVVHGDLHPGNMLRSGDGLVWLDFEDVGRAPREWDLALISWYATEEQLAPFDPDPERLAVCRDLRALQILAGLIAFRGELGRGTEYDAMITGSLPLLTETRELAEQGTVRRPR